jgi:protein phosphatase
MTILHACLTDRGRVHEGNEDRLFADPGYGLYIVADGMAVEEPAQLVVDLLPKVIRRVLGRTPDPADPATACGIRAAISEVSQSVRDAAMDELPGGWLGLGAVLVLALVRGSQALLAHLGDSRIYLLRDRRLELMTQDHSHAEELVRLGKLTREQAEKLRSDTGPTRFAGMEDEAVADTRLVELFDGDRLLLCSDGLTAMLDDTAIERILNARTDPAGACRALVGSANTSGGEDNVTVILADAK